MRNQKGNEKYAIRQKNDPLSLEELRTPPQEEVEVLCLD